MRINIMSRKIVPEATIKISEYIKKINDEVSDIGSDIEDNYNKIVEASNLNKYIEKRKNDFKNINKKCFKCFNGLSLIYDHSIDNLPGAAIFGLLLTTVSFSYAWTGIDDLVLNSGFNIYFLNSNVNLFLKYCMFSSIFVLLLHFAILLHGVSIFILETTREVCVISNVGCYCCKNKNLKKCCVCFQYCAQTVTQIIWGFVGTLSCLIVYCLSIIAFNISSITTISSYFMKNSCGYFKLFVENIRNQSNDYLNLAKSSIDKADNVILMVLAQYNAWIDMKNQFLDSGIKTITDGITTETITPSESYNREIEFESPEQFQYNVGYQRRLMESNISNDFSILKELSKGQSILSVLNKSIYDTEQQIEYYNTILNHSVVVCKEYGNMHDSFYYITLGIGILLISHLIMSAVHYKYFSIWMYEVKLVKLNR